MNATPRRASMSFVDENRSVHCLAYMWIQTDAGRATSKRKAQRNDCTVRALAIARKLPYDTAYDILKAAGRVSGRGFDFAQWINDQPWATKLSFPAVKGKRRMTPAQFCQDYPAGVYILRAAKHVIAVCDGVLHDTFENSPDRCIYGAWRITSS